MGLTAPWATRGGQHGTHRDRGGPLHRRPLHCEWKVSHRYQSLNRLCASRACAISGRARRHSHSRILTVLFSFFFCRGRGSIDSPPGLARCDRAGMRSSAPSHRLWGMRLGRSVGMSARPCTYARVWSPPDPSDAGEDVRIIMQGERLNRCCTGI